MGPPRMISAVVSKMGRDHGGVNAVEAAVTGLHVFRGVLSRNYVKTMPTLSDATSKGPGAKLYCNSAPFSNPHFCTGFPCSGISTRSGRGSGRGPSRRASLSCRSTSGGSTLSPRGNSRMAAASCADDDEAAEGDDAGGL